MIEFFALWTLGFWALFVITCVLATFFEERGKTFFTFLSIFNFIILTRLYIPIDHTTVSHPARVLLDVLGYFVIGTVWGVLKWYFFLRGMLDKFKEAKADFLRKGGGTQQSFLFYLEQSGIEHNPQVNRHKGDILHWMTFWPFSFVWTMISDPITKIFRRIYAAIADTLQALSDRMFAKADISIHTQVTKSTHAGDIPN